MKMWERVGGVSVGLWMLGLLVSIVFSISSGIPLYDMPLWCRCIFMVPPIVCIGLVVGLVFVFFPCVMIYKCLFSK